MTTAGQVSHYELIVEGWGLPRIVFLLSLIVAFVGTPFRLAEAASDLARSMGESESAGAIELIDGGVGDDSGESIRVDLVHDAMAWVFLDDLSGCYSTLPSSPLDLGDRPSTWSSSGSLRRHVLLERFLC